MTSSNDLDKNLEKMRAWTARAAEQGAELVAFPEMAYFMGKAPEWQSLLHRHQELLSTFAGWAKEFKLTLLPGSIREPVSDTRYYNTQWVWNERGEIAARYRKIFLFQANLPDRVYRESLHSDPGDQVVVTEVGACKLGLAICYDLRFPELFRALRKQGSQIVILPAAFTVPTGLAHWATLLRARAIENQIFMLAPGMVGQAGDGAQTYGHTCAISPWGEVLGELPAGEEVLTVDLDLGQIDQAAAKVDPWGSRREDLFPIAGPTHLRNSP
jgi:nitrilase